MAKVTIDNLADSVMGMLKEYATEEVPATLAETQEVVGKNARQALRSSSKSAFGGTGEYASGWTMTKEGDRLNPSVVLHNVHPGLPHLLEHGHAKRGGGRWKGVQHIKPVEEEVIRVFEEKLREAL